MEALAPSFPSVPSAPPRRRRGTVGFVRRGSRRFTVRAGGGRDPVGEGMVVLRKRIREVEIAEGARPPAPEGWMEWEKRYHRGSYNSDVCEAVGALQALLLDTRPCVAFGLVGVVALSVTVAAVDALCRLLQASTLALLLLSSAGVRPS